MKVAITLHSSTRIVVEQTFGLLKGRFRIFKSALNMKGTTTLADNDDAGERDRTATQTMAKVIRSCFVLHNILIDLQDSTVVEADYESEASDTANATNLGNEAPIGAVGGEAAKATRDAVKSYLQTIRQRS